MYVGTITIVELWISYSLEYALLGSKYIFEWYSVNYHKKMEVL